MQSKPASNKKTLLLLAPIILVVIVIIAFAVIQIRNHTSNAKDSICKSSKYSQIQAGMTKAQVIELLDKASSERVKDGVDQNFFYQGANEAKIKEGWIYRPAKQPDSAEIYFDNSGLVSGKNCGQG